MSKSHSVAISAGGMRAIAAVLRSKSHGALECGCEVLFNQPNASTYWIWTIPLQASDAARKYAVDARTFAVTP
jgi:hypothetical protein